MPKVAVLMGSKSDFSIVQPTIESLKHFKIDYEVRVISAHRSPDIARAFSMNAQANGFEVIICAAGKAAHLAGMIAAYTTLPVIAVPVLSAAFDGLDSLLSSVQMPSGVPVATVAVNAGENAGILAAQILGIKYPQIANMLSDFKAKLKEKVINDDLMLNTELT
ncbi:MAG TPA: 5-(carboxyamino)imidazole ribonucleotide mutase [Clostridiales bacterium]|nr:5-(carboxyamino)imidazole ribonucleotide mutase [Clostridiales bacterium]